MDYRKFGRKLVIRMDPGEEILEQLQLVCEKEKVALASVSAIGAVGSFTVGLFDIGEKRYYSTDYAGDYEIASLIGTVTTKDGAFYAHLHMNAGDRENRVFGGHLNRAGVSATCEMILDVMDGTVERVFSEETGLNLMSFQ